MTKRIPSGIFLLSWSVATALGWLLSHPMLQRYVLEAAWLMAVVGVPATAAVSFVRALLRRRRKTDPRWRAIAGDIGRALIVLFCLVLYQPGSVAGVLQWAVLRTYIGGGAWWATASGIGSLIAMNVSRRLDGAGEFVYIGVEGAALGLLQWLVLRREADWAGWWPAVGTVGWLIGGLAIAPAWYLSETISGGATGGAALVVYHTVPRVIGGLVCGIVTGAVLLMLLRNRRTAA